MNRMNYGRPLVAVLALVLLSPALAFAASPVTTNEPIIPALERVSWSAVFAGAVIALAVHAGLSTLGVGIGAAAIDPYDRENPTKGVPTTVLVWMFVSGLVALFAGGWVAGRLAGTVPFDSAIHGAIVWSFATVVLLILATTSVGYIVGGTFRLLGAGVSAAGSVAAAAGGAAAKVLPEAAKMAKDNLGDAIPQLDWKGIQREARKMLHIGGNGGNGGQEGQQGGENKQGAGKGQQGGAGQQGGMGQGGGMMKANNNQQGGNGQGSGLQGVWDDTQDVIEMLTKSYGAIRNGGLPTAQRDELVVTLRDWAGISEQEAEKTLEKWEKMYQQAKQQYDAATEALERKARDAAAATTSAVSRVAVWTFVSLLFGVAVAALGGNIGSTYSRL